MFGLIKWLIIILILGAFFYVANFFSTMDDDVLRQVKNDAIEAIDSGDGAQLSNSLGEQIKADLKSKKQGMFLILKEKIKDSLNYLID